MRLLGSVALACIFGSISVAHAGGLFIPGVGPQAQGRAGAFVAKADDPSALYHNPAGFMKGTGTVVILGSNFVDYDITFARDGVYEEPSGEDLPYAGDPFPTVEDQSSPPIGLGSFQAIPIIAVGTDFGQPDLPVRFGFGLYAPNAYPTRDFESDYVFEEAGVAPPPQRYDVMEQEATTMFPSVAVAYSPIEGLDVGARASWGIGELNATTYTWGIRNYEEWVARDGVFEVDASDNFVPAWGLGALYRATDAVEIGASYHSKATIDATGIGTAVLGSDLGLGGEEAFVEPENEFALCDTGGTVERLKACIQVPLPRIATVGARWILRDASGAERADIELDLRWENWSRASDYEVIVDGKDSITGTALKPTLIRHGFDDVYSVRLGGSYRVPVGANQLAIRGGAAHDTAAADDGWQRVDIDGAARTTLVGGLGYQTGSYRVDVAGGVVLEPDRTAPTCNTSTDMPGCADPDDDTSYADREQPDPIQPLNSTSQQVQSPFNGGDYSSGYVLFSLGLTAWF